MTKKPSPIISGLLNYLVEDGLLPSERAGKIQTLCEQQSMHLTAYLVQEKILNSEQILSCCLKHFNLALYPLEQIQFTWLQSQTYLTPDLICRYRVIPLACQAEQLIIGTSDPSQAATFSALEFYTGLSIQAVLLAEDQITSLIQQFWQTGALKNKLEDLLTQLSLEQNSVPSEDLTQALSKEPVSELVERLLTDAISKRISDIHFEPFKEYCRIRFRRDGLLYPIAQIPANLATRILMRLKVLANLNIAETRIPQDGRLLVKSAYHIDIRLNTCLTLHGEKIVLRILDTHDLQLSIPSLGMTAEQIELFLSKLAEPQGLILVTGPTGSGKTFTLYSALHHLNQIDKNIMTVEDPIEIELAGINQVNVNPKINLTFAKILRTFLRQDPDIIMVGEIRDLDTAQIAIQAAQTGHLVLATVHTNSAHETIKRLQLLGLDSSHLAHSLILIIAQRLVRKLCPICKVEDKLTHPAQWPFASAPATIYRAQGCTACYAGFCGRTGIYECIDLIPNSAMNFSLTPTPLQSDHNPLTGLWQAGLIKISQGLTTLAEIQRVSGQRLGPSSKAS